jgi:hypothetical protein
MSVVLNTTIPSSSLKRNIWHAHTTESVKPLPEVRKFGHVRSEKNLADINTKPLDATAFHRLVGPYLFRNLCTYVAKENFESRE